MAVCVLIIQLYSFNRAEKKAPVGLLIWSALIIFNLVSYIKESIDVISWNYQPVSDVELPWQLISFFDK